MSYVFNNNFVSTFCFDIKRQKNNKEYIFDFNLTNPQIVFSLNSSFVIKISFLLTGSKNFERFG